MSKEDDLTFDPSGAVPFPTVRMVNDKLIAEFMHGHLAMTMEEYHNYDGADRDKVVWYDADCYYSSDWNWLIPVVEKIEFSFEFSVTMCWQHCVIENAGENGEDLRIETDASTKIEATHMGVIEFIKWYNENK